MVIAEGHLITLIRTTGLVQSYHWLLIGWNWCKTIGIISRTAKFFLQLTEANAFYLQVASVQFSHSVMSNSLRTRGLQHARLPCPSSTSWACSNSCPMSQWAIQPSQVLTNHLTQFLHGEGVLLAGGLLCCCAFAYYMCHVLLVYPT